MKGDSIMGDKCVTYHAFRDYTTVCEKNAENEASEKKPEAKGDSAKSEYIAPAKNNKMPVFFGRPTFF
jgi:hypothetical protein